MNHLHNNIRILVKAALVAALVFVATRFLSVSYGNGYVHLGDALAYLGAGLLPLPWAMAAAGVGAALSDLTGGFAVYAPATLIIKALVLLFFTSRPMRILCTRNALALVWASAATVGGYFAADMIITRNLGVAVVDIWGNIVQAVCSTALFVLLAVLCDRAGLKKIINK